jgi:hypothetical protein
MRSMRRALGISLLVLSAALAGSAAGDTPSTPAEVARTWLMAADTGSGAETWALAAPLFQDRISSEQWQKQLTAVRAPLGVVGKRTLTSATHAASVPGAPNADYEVVKFQTEFEHKPNAIETVTTVRQPDGSWRVLDYSVN